MDCPARALPEVQASVEAFQGPKNLLSNLFTCPEGCKWDMPENIEIPFSEHEYQYKKLIEHRCVDKADCLLDQVPVDVMKLAEFYVPPEKEQENCQWQMKEVVMLHACQNKFNNCPHTREVLLNSKSELVECTQDKEWGMGLDQ